MFMFPMFFLALDVGGHFMAPLTPLILNYQDLTMFDPWIAENYLLALSESERKDDLLQLLESIDIRKISSLDHLATIFKSLGRLLLESYVEKYLLALKTSGMFSVLIFYELYFLISCCRNFNGNIIYKDLMI